MKEDFFNNELINRFEEMLDKNQKVYFDVEDFDEIMSYYIDMLEFDCANKALVLAKEQHPGSIEIKIKEVEILLAQEELLKAANLIDVLKDLSDSNADLLMVQGRYWSLSGFHLKAIGFYKKALENDYEDYLYLYSSIGDEYLSLQEIGKALFFFKKSLEIDNQDEYAFYSCIRCFEEASLYKECIDFINQCIDADPYDKKNWFELGLKHFKMNNYQRAVVAFDYAIVIDENFLSAYTHKAKSLEKLEKYQEAISVYQESLHLDESHSPSYYSIGMCYGHMKQFYQALRFFRLAVKGDPQMDKPWFEASCIYEKLENFQEALNHLEKALELDCENTLYWKKSIYLNKSLGFYKEAISSYDTALNLDPNDYHLGLNYVELLIERSEYKKAMAVLNKNLSRFSEKPELRYYTSCCYFFMKQEAKAFIELTKAVKADPSLCQVMMNKYPSVLKKSLVKKILTRLSY